MTHPHFELNFNANNWTLNIYGKLQNQRDTSAPKTQNQLKSTMSWVMSTYFRVIGEKKKSSRFEFLQ